MWIRKVISPDYVYWYAQKMRTNCKGIRKSKTHFGKPILAFSSKYMYKCVGKIAINKAITPQAA